MVSELNDRPTWHLPALRSTPRTKLREAVKEINTILPHIPSQNLTDIHHLLFAAAVVVCEFCDVKFVDSHAIQDEPPWKRRLQQKLRHWQAELSRLHTLKSGTMCNPKLIKRLQKQYQDTR